jgi:hypothetical protein
MANGYYLARSQVVSRGYAFISFKLTIKGTRNFNNHIDQLSAEIQRAIGNIAAYPVWTFNNLQTVKGAKSSARIELSHKRQS